MKMYVLVRIDLKPAYSACQAGHALAQWLLEYGHENKWRNRTLIYLAVDNENELIQWTKKLEDKGIQFSEYRESDLDKQLTAIACFSQGKEFRKLKLLE